MSAPRLLRRPDVALAVLALTTTPLAAQQILLDRPVRAGELIVFPDVGDPAAYYYVPDKPRLATGDTGRPQFSFLRYVENVRSGAAEPEAREGEGGGIVHALVALAVTDEERRDAQRELQRVRPGARLVGPVVFRSGKFGLVSSFVDPEAGLSRKVVGIGNAPLLDGEKAAVSLHLTKLGAKILWESFQTPTPDVSFTFEMDVAGFRSPKRALIEADFDQVYEHEAFGAGVATTYLAGEIKAAFDDLRRSGAIKVTQVGEDQALDALVATAYNKLTEMMFQPVGGTGTPTLESLSSLAAGGKSLLDRATDLLSAQRAAAHEARAGGSGETSSARRRTDEEAVASLSAEYARAAEHLEELAQTAEKDGDPARAATLREQAKHYRDEAERRGDRAGSADAQDGGGAAQESGPQFAIVAAYEMKKVRQRGTFRIDLNKYTTDTLTLRFDENIGDLRRLRGDQLHFRQVNLDDPLYRQRELVAFVDGLNASDFGQYVNFVTVQMRKRHDGGQETFDEVRIDRHNFNREGNAFKLLYGWKGDRERGRWLEYDHRATWSFFGGATVEQPWESATSGAINLRPPYSRRQVTVEVDPEFATAAKVQLVTVRFFYDLDGSEKEQRATLNAAKDELSRKVDFMLPAGRYEFAYEVSYRLGGGRMVSSGRQQTADSVLWFDTLPGKEVR